MTRVQPIVHGWRRRARRQGGRRSPVTDAGCGAFFGPMSPGSCNMLNPIDFLVVSPHYGRAAGAASPIVDVTASEYHRFPDERKVRLPGSAARGRHPGALFRAAQCPFAVASLSGMTIGASAFTTPGIGLMPGEPGRHGGGGHSIRRSPAPRRTSPYGFNDTAWNGSGASKLHGKPFSCHPTGAER